MPHYIIFPKDTAGAMLQHSTEAATPEAALADFSSLVGDISAENFAVVEVTADQRAAVEAWHDDGAPAYDAPTWLDEAIRSA